MKTNLSQTSFRHKLGDEDVAEFINTLRAYKAGKASVEHRAISAEEWWKLKGDRFEHGKTENTSGWLHNVIVSKHADAMEALPEPVILPREEGDTAEAERLTSILPCVLEQNRFDEVYSDNMWQKLKTGTAIYKVFWDSGKLSGLGDISIERVNVLNLFWEPGITDIEQSRCVFQTELCDNDVLKERYPVLREKLRGSSVTISRFLYDDHVDTSGKSTLVRAYYHKYKGGKKLLHYAEFVGDTLLYATENDTESGLSETGLYEHGMYPFVFDSLFPVEGSPCGYGYIDLCKGTQNQIDMMSKAFVDNTLVAATPRYMVKQGGGVNEEEFADITKPLIHVTGAIGPNDLMPVAATPLSGTYVGFYRQKIEELRQTSGNTETSTGNISSGVTAASAIVALQEASAKGSRDATLTSYRAFSRIVYLMIELCRQFYDLPRTYRIAGEHGTRRFISYTNAGLRPVSMGAVGGMELGMKQPVFDIKVTAQRKSAYSRMSQNELALELYRLGFFKAELRTQALAALEMMDFEGRDELIMKLSENSDLEIINRISPDNLPISKLNSKSADFSEINNDTYGDSHQKKKPDPEGAERSEINDMLIKAEDLAYPKGATV